MLDFPGNEVNIIHFSAESLGWGRGGRYSLKTFAKKSSSPFPFSWTLKFGGSAWI
jgi:hypothetical protein